MEIIVALLLLFGAFFMCIAAIGMNRFKDVYSRLHATTKATSFGALLLLLSAALFFGSFGVWLKAILIVVFIYLTAPLAAHSIAKSLRSKEEKQ